jgi:hypothetical protein
VSLQRIVGNVTDLLRGSILRLGIFAWQRNASSIGTDVRRLLLLFLGIIGIAVCVAILADVLQALSVTPSQLSISIWFMSLMSGIGLAVQDITSNTREENVPVVGIVLLNEQQYF